MTTLPQITSGCLRMCSSAKHDIVKQQNMFVNADKVNGDCLNLVFLPTCSVR